MSEKNIFKPREIKIEENTYTLEEELYNGPFTNDYTRSLFKIFKARDQAKKKQFLIKIVYFEKNCIKKHYNGITSLKKDQFKMPQSFLRIIAVEDKGMFLAIVQEYCEYPRLNVKNNEIMKEVKIIPIIREIIKIYKNLQEETRYYFLEKPSYFNEINEYQIFFDINNYNIKIDLLNFYHVSHDYKNYLMQSPSYTTANHNVHIRNLGEIIYYLIFGKKKGGNILKYDLEKSSISKILKILLLKIFYDDKLDWEHLYRNPLFNQLEPEFEDWNNELIFDSFNIESEYNYPKKEESEVTIKKKRGNIKNEKEEFKPNQENNIIEMEKSIKSKIKFILDIDSIKSKQNMKEFIVKIYIKGLKNINDEIKNLLLKISNEQEPNDNINKKIQKYENDKNSLSDYFFRFEEENYEFKNLNIIKNTNGADWTNDKVFTESIDEQKNILQEYFGEKDFNIEDYNHLLEY